MKLGIMQPYFFPYLGYFSLIKHTDQWIIFDVVQFIRHGWIERNRILRPQEGWQYIKVPLVKKSRETLIKDMEINDNKDWRGMIFRQFEHYKKRAPFYKEVILFLDNAFDYQTKSITNLNAHLLQKTCEYIGIPFNFKIFSEMALNIEPVKAPGEWALNISKVLGASQYINPPGGKEIFDKEQFMKSGIELKFLQIHLQKYWQGRIMFEEGLSILDVMMFNSKQQIQSMVTDYELI